MKTALAKTAVVETAVVETAVVETAVVKAAVVETAVVKAAVHREVFGGRVLRQTLAGRGGPRWLIQTGVSRETPSWVPVKSASRSSDPCRADGLARSINGPDGTVELGRLAAYVRVINCRRRPRKRRGTRRSAPGHGLVFNRDTSSATAGGFGRRAAGSGSREAYAAPLCAR
ncbi:hypothetical protein Kfla_7077 [Kribbella flavida DSM 17836]|uniref:Uncharacterized protein n=1 Tax=Kribbella flavida (strain DSM 17836 / JCM 10339 / NBRC 14399) TaxID=479435 RepID=D2Q554_KRIFD|nr:hypothetical protein [Kribbella flavida]ADB36065.1 hypothetical protein Kfla_7077 [Kribbella flavida DSM 17836]